MVTFTQVKTGVAKYITDEIVSKMDSWKKWVFGAGVSVAIARSDEIFAALRNNEFVKMLGVVDENGMIDIDAVYRAFKEQAESSSPISIDIPAIGKITLSAGDVDMLYQYIKQGG